MTDSADVIITGGTIVDGTGGPPRPGTIVVEGDRMRVLLAGELPPTNAGTTIDATDRIVAPGFIDLHSHGGLVILAEPRHEPKVRQGVTTEIVGVDGNGFAPFADLDDLESFVHLDSGLDGRPEIAYGWRTVADYLHAYDGSVSVNVGTLVGNSVLRINAIGWDDVPADEAAIDRMRGTLRDAMADGAVGLSSGLDYPPGSYATTEELAALTRTAGEQGGFYHTHVRYPLGDRFLDPFREAIDIGRRAGAPSHITHFYHRQTHPGGPDRLLALVDDARAEGLDVTFDTYPSEWASTRLLIQLPQWIQAGGPAALQAAPLRPSRPRPTTTGDGPDLHEHRRLGRRPARRLPPPGAAALGVAHGRRRHARDGHATRSTSSATCSSRRTSASARSRAGHGPRRCATSSGTRSGWSAPTRRSSAPSPARGRTAPSRGSSASSSGTRGCSASRRRSAR